jgi:phosphoglycolate phosphatase
MKKVDTIILDFNGTILDDLELCFNVLNKMLVMYNHKPVTLERYLDIFTFPVIEYYRVAGFNFDKEPFDELAPIFIENYQPNSLKCPLHEGVVDMINKWRKENKKIVLLSASKKELLIEQLKHFNILNLFDEVLGTDTINAVGKEYLAEEYLEKNHVNKDTTIMIGDTIHDDEVANVLGVSSFLISKGHQSKERLMTTNAIVLNDIKEIVNYIE